MLMEKALKLPLSFAYTTQQLKILNFLFKLYSLRRSADSLVRTIEIE
jgi:hypothetical protein